MSPHLLESFRSGFRRECEPPRNLYVRFRKGATRELRYQSRDCGPADFLRDAFRPVRPIVSVNGKTSRDSHCKAFNEPEISANPRRTDGGGSTEIRELLMRAPPIVNRKSDRWSGKRAERLSLRPLVTLFTRLKLTIGRARQLAWLAEPVTRAAGCSLHGPTPPRTTAFLPPRPGYSTPLQTCGYCWLSPLYDCSVGALARPATPIFCPSVARKHRIIEWVLSVLVIVVGSALSVSNGPRNLDSNLLFYSRESQPFLKLINRYTRIFYGPIKYYHRIEGRNRLS